MATTKTTEEKFNGTGSQTVFPFTIEYLATSDLQVFVSNVLQTETTHYSISGTNLTFVTAPESGTGNVRISRSTGIDKARAVYAAGSSVRAIDLNNNQDQALFALQERFNTVNGQVSSTAPEGAVNGDRWYDTVSGRTYVYYKDADSSQWVEASPAHETTNAPQITSISDAQVVSNAAINATKLSFTAAGTGATARSVDSKLEDVVSVKDFAAVGDGVADDTAELQAALNAAAGKTLLMPKGIYLISKTLIIPEGTRIIGSGKADVSEQDYTKGTVIKTTGAGTGQVWTDIASGTDATQTPCLVAGGNGIYIENLTVLTDANHWSIGILYPCVKQCSVSKVSMRGFTNACLYLDASRSNINKPTVTDQAGTSVTINCGTGMNEFYAEDFIFRSNTNGVSDFGIKIQGTTRDTSPVGITYVTPTDSTTQSAVDSAASGSNPFWVWGWGGASDIVFNSGRTSGISIDGALSTNVAKTIQGQRFIAVDSRVSTTGVLVNIDRANRVDFISGYGEQANSKIKFTHRTGIVNFLFSSYSSGIVNYLNTGGSTTTHGSLGSTSIVDADDSSVLDLTVYTNDGLFMSSKAQLRLAANTLHPNVDNTFTLGSSSKNFANVRTKKVQSDKFISNQGTELTIVEAGGLGVITATHSYHTVDTEGDAASDNLDTINGGSTGQMLLITAHDNNRTVVVKDDTGNLKLSGDCTLDSNIDSLLLMYVSSYWIEISRSNNG